MLCGLDDTAKEDLQKGVSEGGSHIHKLLKFLTVRHEKDGTRSGINLLGGVVNPAIDGNPSRFCLLHLNGRLELLLDHAHD